MVSDSVCLSAGRKKRGEKNSHADYGNHFFAPFSQSEEVGCVYLSRQMIPPQAGGRKDDDNDDIDWPSIY